MAERRFCTAKVGISEFPASSILEFNGMWANLVSHLVWDEDFSWRFDSSHTDLHLIKTDYNNIKGHTMTWDHRVIKDEYGQFVIHEVYYDIDGNIDGWTANPTKPCGDESLDDLKEDIKIYVKALEKPVLIEVEGKLVRLDTYER